MALTENKKSGASTVNVVSESGAAKLREMSVNTEVYAEFFKFQGRVYKHNANVALEFFAQRPNTAYIAAAAQWNAAGFKIKDGGKAIRFTDTDGNRSELFDFSQVTANNPENQTAAPPIWTLNKDNANLVKKALGIPETTSLIGGMTSVVN